MILLLICNKTHFIHSFIHSGRGANTPGAGDAVGADRQRLRGPGDAAGADQGRFGVSSPRGGRRERGTAGRN